VQKRLLVVVAAATAAVLAMRRQLEAQRAERDLWSEATDDVRAGAEPTSDR
jgi:hypothetical protein